MFYNSSLSYMRACVVFEIVFQSVYKKLTQLFANITPPRPGANGAASDDFMLTSRRRIVTSTANVKQYKNFIPS